MRKKLPFIIAWFTLIVPLVVYFFNFYQLLSKSYFVDESQIYKVDTFHLLNRSYEESGNSVGRGSQDESKLVFESTNRYSFAITKYAFKAITDKKELEDTLMYHDLKFTVYSNKQYLTKYKKTDSPIYIEVYQIEIGHKKYIDISKMNKLSKGDTLRWVIIPPALIFFFGFLLYKESKNKNWWTKRRAIIWCIVFFITIIGLLLLT